MPAAVIAQSQEPLWQAGIYVVGKAGYNMGNTSVTASQLSLNTIPECGLLARYAPEPTIVALELQAGLTTYSAHSFSNDPFNNGTRLTDFRLHAQLHAIGLTAMLELYQWLGIGFTYAVPLRGHYVSTVDVFNRGQQYAAEQTFDFDRASFRDVIELRLQSRIVNVQLPVGAIAFFIGGSYTLSAIAVPASNPQRLYAPNMNQIGLDPLAGLRTFSMQPLSVMLGAKYLIGL
jgi:hypothetical protein